MTDRDRVGMEPESARTRFENSHMPPSVALPIATTLGALSQLENDKPYRRQSGRRTFLMEFVKLSMRPQSILQEAAPIVPARECLSPKEVSQPRRNHPGQTRPFLAEPKFKAQVTPTRVCIAQSQSYHSRFILSLLCHSIVLVVHGASLWRLVDRRGAGLESGTLECMNRSSSKILYELDPKIDRTLRRLRKVMSSVINEQLVIQYFYEGLTMMDRSMIDAASGGALMDKTPTVARHFISNMASNT
ncbi:hypothetical protein CR513_15198, partial [Mucuna pruriens]